MRLPIGDYQIDDKIIIERKTIADFLSSIKNARIFQQAYRMANLPCSSILILEGEKPPPETTKMKRAAIQGVLLHLN
jgi:DNA excision repair protein ERCC-4